MRKMLSSDSWASSCTSRGLPLPGYVSLLSSSGERSADSASCLACRSDRKNQDAPPRLVTSRTTVLCLNIAFALLVGLFLCTSGLKAQEKNVPLENSDVVKMTANHFGDDLLLKIIDKSENHFDVSPTSLIALKKSGVSDKIIAAMQDAVARKQARSVSVAPAANSPAASTSAAPMAAEGNALAVSAIPQMPTVSLVAGGSTSQMQPSIAQIAKTNAPQGVSAANPLTGTPLGSLASQNMTFAALSTAANLIPMVRMATMAGKLLGSVGKSQQEQSSPTFVWGLPNRSSLLATPSSSPVFDVRYAGISGLDQDAFEPVLVKLAQTASNWRLVGAGSVIVAVGGATAPPKITEDRTLVKSTRLAPGHVRLEPAAPLAPGEYAIVFRPVASQAARTAQEAPTPLAPQAAQNQSAQVNVSAQAVTVQRLFFAVWDFSVPAADKSQQ